jgi:hypothetical protein
LSSVRGPPEREVAGLSAHCRGWDIEQVGFRPPALSL